LNLRENRIIYRWDSEECEVMALIQWYLYKTENKDKGCRFHALSQG